ncbi:hypothetical protein ACU4GD_13610 [Cupriavidus basilensis]
MTRFFMDQEDLSRLRDQPGAGARIQISRPLGNRDGNGDRGDRRQGRAGAAQGQHRLQQRHGPVLVADAKGNRAYALRAAWLDLGMGAVLRLDGLYACAQNWDQFRAAMNRWGGARREPGLCRP